MANPTSDCIECGKKMNLHGTGICISCRTIPCKDCGKLFTIRNGGSSLYCAKHNKARKARKTV